MECPICYVPLFSNCTQHIEALRGDGTAPSKRPDAPISSLSCGHCFHTDCLKLALQYKRQCPTCRGKVKPNEPHPLYLQNHSTTESDAERWGNVREAMKIFGPKSNYNYSTCLFVHGGTSDPTCGDHVSVDSNRVDQQIVDQAVPQTESKPSENTPIILQALYEAHSANTRLRENTHRLQSELTKLRERNAELCAKYTESTRRAASLHDKLHSHISQEKKIQEMNEALADGMAGNGGKAAPNFPGFDDEMHKPPLQVLGCNGEKSHRAPQLRKVTPDIVECTPLERAIDKTRALILNVQRELEGSKHECSKLLLENVSLRRKVEKYKRHYADHSSRPHATENGERTHHGASTGNQAVTPIPAARAGQFHPQMMSRPGKSTAVGNEVKFIRKRLRGHSGDNSTQRLAIQDWVANVTPYCPDFQIDP
ncbi:hypothetical protein XU18_1787 [Perkinsela sp. CCAP 1560/4]|nr:hypothetical protein XU18_1787 [Perkinsela sp. CCAP 1560/4]|eukprot:KNH07566.1 hypothetical protein XU18_1787 [Perkinsela sp. CCAP 1560/4]